MREQNENKEKEQAKASEVKCPKCGHTFLHKIGEELKEAGEALGNAIGEAKFGE